MRVKTNKLKVGFPLKGNKSGFKLFLYRLEKSIRKQKLCKTSTFLNPFHEISLFSSIARPYFNKPYVLRLDSINFDTAKNNEELNLPIFESIRDASGLIFQSEFAKKLIEFFYGEINIPSTVILNGVKTNTSDQNYREELNLPKNKKIILTASHWRRFKRAEEIIRSVRILNEKHKDVHLVILGKDFLTVQDDMVEYRGEVSQELLQKYYKSCDLFLHLAWFDNCPNSVVEAIGNNLPIVCSNLGGTKELVYKANAGIVSECDDKVELGLVDLYNPPQPNYDVLVADIEEVLYNTENYRKKMNLDAVNIDLIADEYVNFLEKIIKSC